MIVTLIENNHVGCSEYSNLIAIKNFAVEIKKRLV